MSGALSSDPKRPITPCSATRERSQVCLKARVKTSLRLIAGGGWARLVLGEMAHESRLPIFPLYRYLPEAWQGFASARTETQVGVLQDVADRARSASLQACNELIGAAPEAGIGLPGFSKVAGGAAASVERTASFRVPNPAEGPDQSAEAQLVLRLPAKQLLPVGRSKAAFHSFTPAPSDRSQSRPPEP